MAALRRRTDHGRMTDLMILFGVVAGFAGLIAAVLYGIAVATGGPGPERRTRR